MQVSDKLLRELVNLEGISPQEIKDKLCEHGIEVTGFAPLAEGDKLIIAQIEEVQNVEGSDHLHLLKVNEGQEIGVVDVICGAPNVRVGLKVVVARPGCNLKGGKINEAKIFGHTSLGMCCSYQELGIHHKYLSEEESKGIIELPDDAPVGETEVLKYLHLDDIIYDVELLPSRSYCLSMINFAKELAAIFEREMKEFKFDIEENIKNDFEVGSLTSACPQFAIRVIKDVEVKPSPAWLRFLLVAFGYRSINNIVDIGNFVMILTGQPLHMYDLDKLARHSLIVKDDLKKDFVALDENHYAIENGDICITCDDEIMCLGGVMGALACAVDENSKNIAIESASFYHARIRHTSRRLNLVSESSMRFVKGTNMHQADEVLDLSAKLCLDLANAKEVSNIASYSSLEEKKTTIEVSLSYINQRLATSLRLEEVLAIFNRLEFEVKTSGEKMLVTVPFYRIDLKEPCDLSEEVIRFVGFARVNEENLRSEEHPGGVSLEENKIDYIRSLLLNHGLNECITYSLVNEKDILKFNYLSEGKEAVKLLHPLTDKHAYFRTNLLPSLLEVASYNYTHQNRDFALFEVSDVYFDKVEEKSSRLAIVLVGREHLHSALEVRDYSYYSLKGYLEAILNVLNIDQSRYAIKRLDSAKKEFHPGRSAEIYLGKNLIGVMGEIYPNLKKDYDFGKENVALMELDLSALLEVKVSPLTFKEINRFPTVKRDLALVVKDDVSYASIRKVIKNSGHQLVMDVTPFDLYKGEHLEKGYHSLAITITYGDLKKTLIDEEVNRAENDIKYALHKELGIELRS